jgi:transcriptional regulator GlxA family with amidase domain
MACMKRLSVSVFQLARLVDLSSSQFARMFKASTGVSPHRYQLNTRIGKAQELLLMKGESLSMVAVATGFADQSHFTRTFKRALELHHTSGIRIAPPRGCDMKLMRQGRVSHTAPC